MTPEARESLSVEAVLLADRIQRACLEVQTSSIVHSLWRACQCLMLCQEKHSSAVRTQQTWQCVGKTRKNNRAGFKQVAPLSRRRRHVAPAGQSRPLMSLRCSEQLRHGPLAARVPV